jgi:hypothetical protein
MQRHGALARMFITVNRAFGLFLIAGGLYITGVFGLAMIRGRMLSDVWWVGAMGILCLSAGYL